MPLQIEMPSGQAAEGLKILRLCALCYFFRKTGRGRLLVPVDRLKIIANKLLVEGWLSAAGLPGRLFPEARRVRCQHLISKDDPFGGLTKLKFCVGQDDSARLRMLGGPVIEGQREPLQFCRIGAPSNASVAAKEMFSSCAPSWLLVAGVNTGSGRRDPSSKPLGSGIPQTVPVA